MYDGNCKRTQIWLHSQLIALQRLLGKLFWGFRDLPKLEMEALMCAKPQAGYLLTASFLWVQEIARAGQLVNQGPVCNAMTQGPNWLELAKQLCATQPMQGLTINVHYHGASPAASSGLYHAHGLGGADKQATQDVLPTCKDGGNLRDISNAQIRQPQVRIA